MRRTFPSLLPPFLLATTFATTLATPTEGCTTFCLRGGGRIVFGKNYDWSVGEGLLVVNQRGLARKADATVTAGRPASWTSRYGSVTFNQYGRDFPSGGMNEAGLAIELMWLDGARYPAPDGRAGLDVLQWIQYNLDRHATVAEVLAADREIRITGPVPLHYLVADRKGNVATVEILDGKMVAHTGKSLPVAALANSTYASSLKAGPGAATRPVTGEAGSLARFARAAQRVKAFDGKKGDAVAYAFETLDQVAQGSYTKWSIVYEIDRLRLHFRTRDHRQVRSLRLADLDFRCGKPTRVLRLDAKVKGDIAKSLVPYTRQINYDTLLASMRKTPFLATTPENEIERQARYPEAAVCRL